MRKVLFLFSVLMCLFAFQDVQAGGSSPPGLKLEVAIDNYCPVSAVVDAPLPIMVAELYPTLYLVTVYQGSVCQGDGILKSDYNYFISSNFYNLHSEVTDQMIPTKEYSSLGYSMWN